MGTVKELTDAIEKAVNLLKANKGETEEKRAKRLAAVEKVRVAALRTKAYQRQEPGDGEAQTREEALSLLWQDAASAIYAYDRALADVANVKALGWADPAEWTKPGVDLDKLNLDLILKQCDWLRDHSGR